ncbi:hypothetical protein TIFTF001_015492 [Ficus carica]|uniref:Uncharacterized protein n=1 Tax=Ficus carica TaxID=3494 RepID=A0AA88A5X0_FICCA|nr:hypothetical protein TIFTF001_015492 [Ficus carica]
MQPVLAATLSDVAATSPELCCNPTGARRCPTTRRITDLSYNARLADPPLPAAPSPPHKGRHNHPTKVAITSPLIAASPLPALRNPRPLIPVPLGLSAL